MNGLTYNKKTQNAWAFYDWANSVYSLVISTAVFPIYYSAVTSSESGNIVRAFGMEWENSVIYSYSLSFSFLLVALMSPLLGGIADYTGSKKKFLKFFCYMGSLACGSLFFFTGDQIEFALIASIIASVGFWGSLVFYNAFLPEVAPLEEQDSLSAKGFSLGYIGGAILLIINLVLINFGESFGITDSTLPARISFLTVALWWAGFAQISLRRLPDNPYKRKPDEKYIRLGVRELKKVVYQLGELPYLKTFLIAFFLFSVGVQTVILMAGIFGEKELGLPTGNLILTILIIQIVAIGGAQFFAFLSGKIGNFKALFVAVLIWLSICFAAFILPIESPRIQIYFYLLGGAVGLVMGGIQSLARSTYSKLLPETKDHASFFSFFDLTEKIAIIAGTFTFGLIEALTGSMQNSSLALGVFFLLSGFILFRLGRLNPLLGNRRNA